MLKILRARLQQFVNCELPNVQAGFRKGRGTRDQIANIRWNIEKSKRVPEKHLLLLHWLCQSLWLCGSQQTVENSERDFLKGILDHLTSWETYMQVKKQQSELDMEQQTGSKSGKECIKAAYCHLAYLTYMQSTLCEMPGWMSTSWNQRCREKYQYPQVHRWHHPSGIKQRTKEPIDESKRGEWKSWLKTQHSKN